MNYLETRKVYEKRVEDFIKKHGFYAFNEEQLEEGKKAIGVTDNNNLVDVGCGLIFKARELDHLKIVTDELEEAIIGYVNTSIENFTEAFEYELNNREGDLDEALMSIGIDDIDNATQEQKRVIYEVLAKALS